MTEKDILITKEDVNEKEVSEESEELTRCERMVIKVIWESEKLLSIKEVTAKVNERFERGWKVQTVSSLLGHLVRKGYLSMERSGRTFFYSPLVTEEETLTRQITRMLDFWCEGHADEFLKNFLKDRALTEEEKVNMRKIINDLN